MTDATAADFGSRPVQPLRLVIAVQGFAYLVTGLWPLVHRASFVALAGPKPDRYQFLATVFLVLAIAIALILGSLPVRRPQPVGRGLYALAVGTPLAFVLLYGWAVAEHEQLSAAYWVDFLFELVFLVLLVWVGLRSGGIRDPMEGGAPHSGGDP